MTLGCLGAAGVFFLRRGRTAHAQIADVFSNNENMNHLYEGMILTTDVLGNPGFENPLFNSTGLDDGFSEESRGGIPTA